MAFNRPDKTKAPLLARLRALVVPSVAARHRLELVPRENLTAEELADFRHAPTLGSHPPEGPEFSLKRFASSAPGNPHDLTTTVIGDVVVVAINGELDLALSSKLTPDVNAVLRSPAHAIVLDLEAVTFIDSSGIALLINIYRRLDYAGRQLAIALPPGPRRRAIELTGLDRQLPLYETREAALVAVRTETRQPSASDHR